MHVRVCAGVCPRDARTCTCVRSIDSRVLEKLKLRLELAKFEKLVPLIELHGMIS